MSKTKSIVLQPEMKLVEFTLAAAIKILAMKAAYIHVLRAEAKGPTTNTKG